MTQSLPHIVILSEAKDLFTDSGMNTKLRQKPNAP